MAGNDNSDWVASIRVADCAYSFGVANGVGDILVASGFAIRYLKQCVPYLALEKRALWRKI